MWIIHSLGAMGLLAVMLLLLKQAGQLGCHPITSLFYVFLIGSLITFVYASVTRTSLLPEGNALVFIALSAGASFAGNLLYFHALQTAPNPGYPAAIEGGKAFLVVLAACVLFGAKLSLLKAGGTVLCLAGVILLCL